MAEVKNNSTQKSKDEDRVLAALSYLNVLVFVPLLTKQKNDYVQFHAKQGLGLFMIECVGVLLLFTVVLGFIATFIFFICGLLSLYGIYNALMGKKVEIPGVGRLADKLNL